MTKNNFLTILDIDSEKLTAAVGINKNENVEVIALAETISAGLDKGNVVSIEKVVDSIQKILDEIETKFGKRIKELCIGIKGDHVEVTKAKGIVNISRSNKEVTDEDKKNVLNSVRGQISLGEDRSILEIIPVTYTVDSQTGILDPKGMEAHHLGIEAFVVTASTVVLNNIYKCVGEAGFKVANICYSEIALADSCLLNEEKEVGVVLVNIGSKLTNLSFYQNNKFLFSKKIAIGNDLIVNDVSYGIKTSIPSARELIQDFGAACVAKNVVDQEIKFVAVDGITEKKIFQNVLCEIINARAEEIIKIIGKVLKENNIDYSIPAGIVLTGIGAKLKHLSEFASEVLNMPVRIGLSRDISGDEKITKDAIYSSALGVLQYFFRNSTKIYKMKNSGNSTFSNLKKKLEEIF